MFEFIAYELFKDLGVAVPFRVAGCQGVREGLGARTFCV